MEFASPEWLAFFARLLVARAAMGETPEGVTCEVYRKVPSHLAPTGELAWTRRVQAGVASVELIECPDAQADTKLVGDYDALLPLARLLVEDDGAKLEAGIAAGIAAGTLDVIERRPNPDAPRDFTVHNMMAVLTR